MRRAKIFMFEKFAGLLEETEDGYQFTYDPAYLADASNIAVSLTLPMSGNPHFSKQIFSFFDGLIPEGWLLDIAQKNWKLNPRDRMGLLLACCKDTIGAVSVEAIDNDE